MVVLTLVFVESGLLVGFFLPGDTVLFAAGLLTARPGSKRLVARARDRRLPGRRRGRLLGYAFGSRLGRPWLLPCAYSVVVFTPGTSSAPRRSTRGSAGSPSSPRGGSLGAHLHADPRSAPRGCPTRGSCRPTLWARSPGGRAGGARASLGRERRPAHDVVRRRGVLRRRLVRARDARLVASTAFGRSRALRELSGAHK